MVLVVLGACANIGPIESLAPTDQPRSSAKPTGAVEPTTLPSPGTTPIDLPSPTATAVGTPEAPPVGVRACDYDPLISVPAEMPPEVTDRTPDPIDVVQPPNTDVDSATTKNWLELFHALVDVINDEYVYIDLPSLHLDTLTAKYEALIQGGLTDDDFYFAMDNFIFELGDEHSSFEDPEEVIAIDDETSGSADYVGVGVLFQPVLDTERAVIIQTFPGGSAAESGIKPHDAVLAVDGEPILDPDGVLEVNKVRGPEGTQVTLTIQTPGQPARDITMVRRRISSAAPVDFCMIPRTDVAYVFLPTLFDEGIPDKMRAAMTTLTASGPLDGLILDSRMNGGGFSDVLEDVLSLFTDGTVGFFVSRHDREPLEIEAAGIGNSQTVPMVVLVDLPTASFGEVMSGVLQNSGRAEVVGQNTLGNVEILHGFNFDDGSRAWIARDTFEPQGLDLGVWEETGIVPDVSEPTRWDLFTEATDPALPAALDVLADQGVPVPDTLLP